MTPDLQYELDKVLTECICEGMWQFQKKLKEYNIKIEEEQLNKMIDDIAGKIDIKINWR